MHCFLSLPSASWTLPRHLAFNLRCGMLNAEIRFGIERTPDADFHEELNQCLNTTLRLWFSDRILEVDEEMILIWRKMVEQGRKQGYTFNQSDLFIAATAVLHDL
ncbi:MAG: hypothetical protein ACUVQO_03820 [Leptodesmis sp.]